MVFLHLLNWSLSEHLTETEMDRLLAALKQNRHGQRDWLIGLLILSPRAQGERSLRPALG
jgi:hypothetical protein